MMIGGKCSVFLCLRFLVCLLPFAPPPPRLPSFFFVEEVPAAATGNIVFCCVGIVWVGHRTIVNGIR